MKYSLFFSFLAFLSFTAQAQVKLAKNILIEGSEIKLGDIFQGLEKNQEKVIGDAPLPGKKYVLSVKNLRKIANQEEIDWTPESFNDSALVQRSSQTVNMEEILEILKAKLAEQISFEDYDIALNGSAQEIHVPIDEPITLAVLELKLNAGQSQFTAKISAGTQCIRLNGKINPLTRVPVLIRVKAKGEIIDAEDLTWIKLPASQVNPGIIVQEESLIGSAPKRAILKANHPIRKHDLESSTAVRQGQLVSVIVKSPFMTLQTQGKAKNTGGMGETISVVNLDSKTVLQGKVIGRDLVEIPFISTSNLGASS